ncbi:MAG: amidophosphoribosyltransferase [Candidatus Methanomethylicia archaeon]
MENLTHNCGVSAIYRFDGGDVIDFLYWSLVSLNHRGHHSYGMVTYDGSFHVFKDLGLISDISLDKLSSLFKELVGNIGLGHVRYATSGELSKLKLSTDIQPLIVGEDLKVCIAYNGNITNVKLLREKLLSYGYSFKCTSDTEVLALILLHNLIEGYKIEDAVKRIMNDVDGAYSVVGLLSDGTLFFFRDPCGIRPLVYGFSKNGNMFMVASESSALNSNNIRDFKVVEPGFLYTLSNNKLSIKKIFEGARENLCSFEFAYFARPDSKFNGKYVCEVRQELGRKLAIRYNDIARRVDVIVPIPQTAVDAAYGFHEVSGKPMQQWIVRDRYVKHRAFILSPEDRTIILHRKYNILFDKLRGKKIALIDDSIVRGDTLKTVVSELRKHDVSEIHIFVTFPKIIGPCFYGIDMATFQELAAFGRSDEEICKFIGADTINYQTIEDFVSAISSSNLCLGCLTLNYPTKYAMELSRLALELALKGVKIKGRITEEV